MSQDFGAPPSAQERHVDAQEKLLEAQKLLDKAAAERRETLRPKAEDAVGEADEILLSEERMDLQEVEVTEDEKTAFFESVLAGVPYSETFPMFDGKMMVTLRARRTQESEEALLETSKQDSQTMVDYEAALTLRSMAFSLVLIKTEKKEELYDQGPLEERIGRLHRLPTPLYTALMEILGRFDRKTAKLSHMSTLPNFWLPASGISN